MVLAERLMMSPASSSSNAIFNTPMKPTKPKQAALSVLSIRRRMYDNESLMIPNDQWNPATRLSQMRENYDRLVFELGVSPRGSERHARLPRVPANRSWQQGAKTRRRQFFNGPDSPSGGSQAQTLATARLLQRVDSLTADGKLTVGEGKRLRKLWQVQESLLQGGDEDNAMLTTFQQLLLMMQQPSARETPADEIVDASAGGASPAVCEEREPASQEVAQGTAPADEVGGPSEEAAEQSVHPPSQAPAAGQVHQSTPKKQMSSHHSSQSARQHAALWDRLVSRTRKVAGGLSSWFRAHEVDRILTRAELLQGFHDVGLHLSEEEVDEVVKHCSRDDGSLSSKLLCKELRLPVRLRLKNSMLAMISLAYLSSQSSKSVHMIEREAAAAGEMELTEREMRSEPLTAEQKAEQQLLAGRFPSLSPDEDDVHDAGSVRKNHAKDNFVWNQLAQRLAPNGMSAAPSWQKSALERVHFKVEQRRAERLSHKHQRVPSWDPQPKGKGKQKLIERELRELHEAREELVSPNSTSSKPRGSIRSDDWTSRDAALAVHEHRSVINHAQELLDSQEAESMTPSHMKKLKALAASFESEMMNRMNRIAYYEQSLQQLQLQRQELEASIEVTNTGIEAELRNSNSVRSHDVNVAAKRQAHRRQRVQDDLQEVQSKANEMESATQALMHVINSLRITRVSHVNQLKTLVDKERQIDSDSQFLIGSGSSAMEERERLRSKMERLKHESQSWKTVQLREAQALNEQLTELHEEQESLDSKLNAIDEELKRTEFKRVKGMRKQEETRERRFGFLQQQSEGWQVEFARVTDITGVSFNDGRRDAVDKVVAIYREKEARNKSLYKYVTEDVVMQMEKVEHELLQLQQEAAMREAGAVESEASSKGNEASSTEVDKYVEMETLRARSEMTFETLIPLLEKLGCFLEISLPRHMVGKPLTPVTLEAFLTRLEEAMDEKIAAAHHICRARQAKSAPEEDGARKSTEIVSQSRTLALIKEFIKPKVLPTYIPASKLHAKKSGVDTADIIEIA
ncbi:MAG: hypothetical protein SGPRY_002809 [Prymnesium sp.]